MRKVAGTAAAILFFGICAVAQKDDNSRCPSVTVNGPAVIVKPGEPQQFLAFVRDPGEYRFEYAWQVDGGMIIEGEGTKSITVVQPSELAGHNWRDG